MVAIKKQAKGEQDVLLKETSKYEAENLRKWVGTYGKVCSSLPEIITSGASPYFLVHMKLASSMALFTIS
jgi:hypothetical protein